MKPKITILLEQLTTAWQHSKEAPLLPAWYCYALESLMGLQCSWICCMRTQRRGNFRADLPGGRVERVEQIGAGKTLPTTAWTLKSLPQVGPFPLLVHSPTHISGHPLCCERARTHARAHTFTCTHTWTHLCVRIYCKLVLPALVKLHASLLADT